MIALNSEGTLSIPMYDYGHELHWRLGWKEWYGIARYICLRSMLALSTSQWTDLRCILPVVLYSSVNLQISVASALRSSIDCLTSNLSLDQVLSPYVTSHSCKKARELSSDIIFCSTSPTARQLVHSSFHITYSTIANNSTASRPSSTILNINHSSDLLHMASSIIPSFCKIELR